MTGKTLQEKKNFFQKRWDDFSTMFPHRFRYTLTQRHKLLDGASMPSKVTGWIKKLTDKDGAACFLSL